MIEKQTPELQRLHLLCVICGTPIAKGIHCASCIDRGFGPCEVCEGLSSDEVEDLRRGSR